MKTDIGLLLMRLVFGGVMLGAHGWPKLMRYSELMSTFPDPLGIGSSASLVLTIFAEVVCAVALMLGILTRYATIPLMIAMAVAAFVVHASDPFQKKELGILFLTAYAALWLFGPGRYSIDKKLGRA